MRRPSDGPGVQQRSDYPRKSERQPQTLEVKFRGHDYSVGSSAVRWSRLHGHRHHIARTTARMAVDAETTRNARNALPRMSDTRSASAHTADATHAVAATTRLTEIVGIRVPKTASQKNASKPDQSMIWHYGEGLLSRQLNKARRSPVGPCNMVGQFSRIARQRPDFPKCGHCPITTLQKFAGKVDRQVPSVVVWRGSEPRGGW